MRRILFLLFLALWCCATSLKAQDTVYVVKPRFYFQLGVGYPLPYNRQPAANAAVVLETKRNFAYGIRYFEHLYLHQVPSSDHVDKKYVPNHEYREINLSVGKIMALNKKLFLTTSVGPSYVNYIMPYNVKKVPSPNNSWGGFFNSSIYEYEIRRFHLLGVSLRGDLAFYPRRKVGMSLGGFLSLNQKNTQGGIDLNLLIGGTLREKNH
ncbi:hypothetical protein ACFSC6_06390 [Rufibacter sediminis]|uniref:Outer membrane protein beta-barrel domain-containing protein n=1 Tax=Rufibacter sediminis TaxID=2762756 RepID=A0ABR6VN27_9BACT|nr:hypothetical protein [Rufibacter sediminis]MBC3538594.1 hypothetical protein [Rufibacter sediminis]